MNCSRRQLVIAVLIPVLALGGCKAKQPGKLETGMMTRAKQLLIGNRKEKNPLENNPQTVEQGRENFSHYCAACHGLDGQNTGVPFAEKMSPPVPRLNSQQVQAYSDGQLKWIIDNGIFPSGMPASRGTLNDEEIWTIVTFIRHLPPAGSLGEPMMYSGGNCTENHTAGN
jgi:S-disulfanyl-L-cysteine oxidoreductase SoxD